MKRAAAFYYAAAFLHIIKILNYSRCLVCFKEINREFSWKQTKGVSGMDKMTIDEKATSIRS